MIMARGQHPDTLGTLKIAGFSGCLLPKYGNFIGNSSLIPSWQAQDTSGLKVLPIGTGVGKP